MILLWGLPGDDPFDAVTAALAARRADFAVVDQREVLQQRLQLEGGDGLETSVWSGDRRFALSEVRAFYARVYDSLRLKKVASATQEVRAGVQRFENGFWAWADQADARIVNRPSAMASNGSKPYQTALIERLGFHVPETLITTDPRAAAEFWERHGQVVYKSVSSVRSIVCRLTEAHRARLEDVTWCPTQFQAYVPGRDHRVHVVGDEVFPVEVVSDADDYRYASAQGASCELFATALPIEVADRARAVAKALDLPVCGIDLRRTPDDRWYCFEANPSPCFTYYERQTGQPIAAALAAWLDDGAREGALRG
jgi:glutathione synthase/RimK-type ligase-like ATP-grasp enzyme